MTTRDFTQQNRRAWNEIAPARRAKTVDPAFIAKGGCTLPDDTLRALGDVRGKRILNLQCANGEDALSLAALGAEVVGVDLSDVVIEISRDQAARAGIDATFVACDVYDLPETLQRADFDVVFSRIGIVMWLPDLDAWASVVARALHPGGRFLLEDMHPFSQCLWYVDDGVEVRGDYFARDKPQREDGGLGRIAFDAPTAETHYQFAWPLGDVVTAVARAGMRIESLEEWPTEASYYLKARPDVRIPPLVERLPGAYRLVATR